MSSSKELALDSQEFQRIGEKISYCRRLLGLTQKELGQVTGISASYIAKIESGQCLAGLSLDLFFAYVEVLIRTLFRFSPRIQKT